MGVSVDIRCLVSSPARSRAKLHVPHGCRQPSYCLGIMGTSNLWSVSRKLRNRAAHALTGNGPARRRLGTSTSTTTSALSAAQQRAKLASRAALPSELAAIGFSLSSLLPLRPQELLHLHRRRLTAEERARVLTATGASHIVGMMSFVLPTELNFSLVNILRLE